jgi:hypothetical protein
MKSVELDEATAALKDYAEQLTQDPIVLTRGGKAIAALVRLRDSDLESFLVSESPVFSGSSGDPGSRTNAAAGSVGRSWRNGWRNLAAPE